ncbi:hypothetical protein ACQ4LE_002116 [Meloidogyne hapla]|uniref:Uncharacterized protein n=1 Tax=Meloidogyne hapla TaxID=6305 RepID=A0A1I8AZL7_MELHA
MTEINKLIQAARLNFADNQFSNWLNVNKYFNLLKNADLSLTEDVYRAYAAIIDALLLHHLDEFSQKNFLNTKKIAYLILQLDAIILKSTQIEGKNSKNFKLLDYLVKCIIYTRIGDFINACVLAEKSPISSKKQKQLILAIYSYSLAYEYAFKGLELGEDVDQNLYAVLSLYALELVVLIRKNSVDENSLFFCNNFMLGSFIFNYAQTFTNLPKGNKENESFVISDQTTILRRLNDYFDGERCLKKSFLLVENIYFLRRFVWLLEEFDEFKEGIYPFIDDLFNSLPECPQDAYNACSPESISRADIKIFLFRLSNYLKCKFNNNQIDFTLSWIFYKKPHSNHQQFWNFVKSANDEGISNINLNILIQITTALEQIRDPNMEIIQTNSDDLINIINFINKLKLKEENNFLKIILGRYSNLLKQSIPENDWIFVVDENKIEAKEENLINIEKEEEIIVVEDENINKLRQRENIRQEPEKQFSTISTQTEQNIEQINQQNRQIRIIQDWGEANFHINRWIYHNAALCRMFNKK